MKKYKKNPNNQNKIYTLSPESKLIPQIKVKKLINITNWRIKC